ncbi:hypothetical protein F5Y08DRAFT_349585 [Xylaria arbuscula]|nr:hypothetical protein F5Y08DRAFT_349585 [Xylaria arbuscula]
MRLDGITLFSTLALSTWLSHAASVNNGVASLGKRDVLGAGLAIRADNVDGNAAVADGVGAVDENEDQQNEGEEVDEENNGNVDENEDQEENADGNENENVDENLDEENNENLDDLDENVDQNEDEDNNQNDLNNIGQAFNGSLGDSFNDINIDPNDIEGSIGQNILNLLLSMGICNFNLNSLGGLGLGNEIQLLLQLQQLQQLQALGIVNSFTVDQLIQREILSNTFNLNIIKRSIDSSVKQAARSRKRTVMLRRQCANAGRR